MDNFEEQNCRLCLSTVSDEHFKEMKDVTKTILDFLLKLNLDGGSKYITCNVCSWRVMEAFRFKSMCVCTENTITPYVDDETECPIDLKEIYMKQAEKKHLIPTLEDYEVCRFCMQLVKDTFIPAHEMAVDMIKLYIPEINLTVVRDPVLCEQCFDSFVSHSNFIRNCLEVNEKIKSFCDTELVDDSIWTPAVDSYIKTEEVDIKPENEQEEWLETDSTVGKFEYKVILNKTNHGEIKAEDENVKSEAACVTDCVSADSHKDAYKVGRFQCDTCDSSCKHKYNLKRDPLRCKYISGTETFHKTKDKKSLKRRKLRHRDISKTKLFECDTCDFKTKHKKSLKQHQLMHEDISVTEVFACNTCDYKTQRKGNLKIHQLKHKDISKMKVFQCDTCDYKTKVKSYLNQHQLIHKDISEREIFECDICGFRTKYKKNVKRHQLTHKGVSETVVFECDTCDYKTKRKDHLRDHVLAHKETSERAVFECDTCDFKSKYKNSLKKHLLTHKDVSETKVFECDTCDYKTKQKGNLKSHQLIHRDVSETELLECDACGHKFKLKHSLKKHIRRKHRDPKLFIKTSRGEDSQTPNDTN